MPVALVQPRRGPAFPATSAHPLDPEVSGGLLNRARVSAQGLPPGGLPHFMPLVPSAAMGMPPPHAGRGLWPPVHQLQGGRRKRGGAQLCQPPPSLLDPEPCSWSLPNGDLTVEWRKQPSEGRGVGLSHGAEEFHVYSHSYTGNSWGVGRGALGHSSILKGSQTVNVWELATVHCWPCRHNQVSFPGNHLAL